MLRFHTFGPAPKAPGTASTAQGRSIQRARDATALRQIGPRCAEHQAEAAQSYGTEGRSGAIEETAKGHATNT
jgi:hypothetical protein